MREYEHPKLNGRFHALLTWMVVLSGLVLGIVFYELISFGAEGGRYTNCDAEYHELIFHNGELSQECKEETLNVIQ